MNDPPISPVAEPAAAAAAAAAAAKVVKTAAVVLTETTTATPESYIRTGAAIPQVHFRITASSPL